MKVIDESQALRNIYGGFPRFVMDENDGKYYLEFLQPTIPGRWERHRELRPDELMVECSFCGETITRTHNYDEVRDHIKRCLKHPLHQILEENNQLKKKIERLEAELEKKR
jgi:hypothetical protein